MDVNNMEIGWIDQGGLEPFRNMLLPKTAQALEQGHPLTTLGVTQNNCACGAVAAWLLEEGTLEIQSLFVAPAYRRQGVGRLLVDTLCRLVHGHCQAVSISYTRTQSDHDTLPPFLDAMGFEQEPQPGNVFRVTLAELAHNPFFSAEKAGSSLQAFAQLPKAYLMAAYKKALLLGENYLEVHLDDPAVDQEVSVAMMQGNAVRSFAAFTSCVPGQITLAWLRSDYAQDIPQLLRGAFARIQAKYPPDTVLTIQASHPVAAALVKKLAPEAHPISHTYVKPMGKA